MTWKNYYEGVRAFPSVSHEFSVSFLVPERKWVLYHGHPMAHLSTSTKVGLFDSMEEAQATAEVIWRYCL